MPVYWTRSLWTTFKESIRNLDPRSAVILLAVACILCWALFRFVRDTLLAA